jgi:hypothetical protein
MHSDSDVRIVKCLDGLHFSFEILDNIYSTLYETCLQINNDQSLLIPTLWRCWSFVDTVHRIREISQALPGLSKKQKDFADFLDATKLSEEYRHYIQHLRNELSKKEVNPFPVWGSLSWVDQDDISKSYVIFIGARIGKTSYTGNVFDTWKRKWVSKVCLGINDKSYHFDPIYDACKKFSDFVFPWMLSKYKPGIKLETELPIITLQITEQLSSEA